MPLLTGAYDDLTVTLSQILFPIVVLLGLFGIVTGILNSYDEFSIPALTPVAWNLAIIVGLVFGVPRADTETGKLYVYAGSILLGTVIQLLLPLPWLRGLDGRLRLALDIRDPAVKQVFTLMMPVTLGLGLINVNAVIGTIVASKWIDPFISPNAIDKAFRIYMLPQGMFSVAVATVLFPTLARLATRGDLAGVRNTIALGSAPDQLPAPARRSLLDRPGRADRPPALPARRVRARADARRRRRARGLLGRAHLQRDDADAEPRLLQPAAAVGPDRDRAREPRAQRRALRRLLPRRHLGDPVRDLAREHRRRRDAALRPAPPDRPARPGRDGAVVRARHDRVRAARASRATASGAASTRRSAARSSRSSTSLGVALVAGGAVYLAACRALRVRELATLLSLRGRSRRG